MMRDFLEEAEAHRKDGYRAAQSHARQQAPKRFYKDVTIGEDAEGFAVLLDGKAVRTPGLKPIRLQQRAIAEAIAEEWRAQKDTIEFAEMPLVRLVNSGIEAGDGRGDDFRAEVIKYCGSDLLLYRADTPRELVAAQEAAWDPILVALARHFDVVFQPTIGIVHVTQPERTLSRLDAALDGENLLRLTAMASLISLTGSGLITIALSNNLIAPDAAWAAAHVDEDHNIRLWGEDAEASQRRAFRRREFDAAVRLLALA
jgi:chaperone required for assembly of F1-ATPase